MAQSADDSSYPRRFGLLRRLTLLALLVAVVGLPLNHLFGYGVLVAATLTATITRYVALRTLVFLAPGEGLSPRTPCASSPPAGSTR